MVHYIRRWGRRTIIAFLAARGIPSGIEMKPLEPDPPSGGLPEPFDVLGARAEPVETGEGSAATRPSRHIRSTLQATLGEARLRAA